MVAERQFQGYRKTKVFIFICAVTVVLSGSCLFAVEGGAASGPARYRVFSLKHISAEQGKKYLAEAGVGTVSQLPGLDALLVTAKPDELIKASAILELVDAEELFYIKAIFPASEVKNLASNKQIAAEVGDISIGTFSEPPSNAAKTKAIIDVHEDVVIAVAPVGQLERIISAIERLRSTEAQALRRSELDKSAGMDEAGGARTETVTESELKRAKAELERIAASFDLLVRLIQMSRNRMSFSISFSIRLPRLRRAPFCKKDPGWRPRRWQLSRFNNQASQMPLRLYQRQMGRISLPLI